MNSERGRRVSENGRTNSQEKVGFRVDRVANLPEPSEKRERIGEDLQPVGDYAGIEPYYRVCEDAGAVQRHDRDDPDGFASGEWWWDQRQIRFLNGKAFVYRAFGFAAAYSLCLGHRLNWRRWCCHCLLLGSCYSRYSTSPAVFGDSICGSRLDALFLVSPYKPCHGSSAVSRYS